MALLKLRLMDNFPVDKTDRTMLGFNTRITYLHTYIIWIKGATKKYWGQNEFAHRYLLQRKECLMPFNEIIAVFIMDN